MLDFREYSQIPLLMQHKIIDYVLDGIHPGHFLTAVIENNLAEACGYADHINVKILDVYVKMFWNETPSPCHGTPEKLKAWVAQGGCKPHERELYKKEMASYAS